MLRTILPILLGLAWGWNGYGLRRYWEKRKKKKPVGDLRNTDELKGYIHALEHMYNFHLAAGSDPEAPPCRMIRYELEEARKFGLAYKKIYTDEIRQIIWR